VAIPQVSLSVGKYWIIPSTYNAGVQAAFPLTVYSTTAGVNVMEKTTGVIDMSGFFRLNSSMIVDLNASTSRCGTNLG